MTTGAKRAVWVACAIVGLGLIVTASLCRGTSRPPAPAIAGTELKLDSFAVEGSGAFRAELHDGSGGYSSGYGRTRNIAFIEKDGTARWLVADDAHTVEEHPIPPEPMYGRREPIPPVAYAALVKPLASTGADGVVLLYDRTGSIVQSVADGVVDVHGVALSPDGTITVFYERPGQYLLATCDPTTLGKNAEVVVAMPELRRGGRTRS
jgi:hypothetical protein